MKLSKYIYVTTFFTLLIWSCNQNSKDKKLMQSTSQVTAKYILGNSDYLAMSYGGYRENTRDSQPTIKELKEDLKILSAMGIKVLRTYNVQLPYPHASNILKAITELKAEDSSFEMYVMLGAWINCLNAWTDKIPNHEGESPENEGEINRAVALANKYPDIVKVIAVGNEAMVRWQEQYYVQPGVILKWVNYLQNLKKEGTLSKDLWITSSDNFASWGGGGEEYHVEDLNTLIHTVDFIAMHSYPMHDTHYVPAFWGVRENESQLSDLEKIDAAMLRSLEYIKSQYDAVFKYINSIGANTPIHIGETGWASSSNSFYGPNGSKATDEYKEAKYYELVRNWTNNNDITCFYFEGFDEHWKDSGNPQGSENHFGLFKMDGQAKFAMWNMVDEGVFDGLTRNGNPITKTYNGNKDLLMKDVLVPPTEKEIEAHK